MTTSGNCVNPNTSNSNILSMTVYHNPVINLDKTPGICAGTARLLDAGDYISYLWNDGSIQRNLSISTKGTYYVFVKDKNNCSSSDTVSITTVNNPPAGFLTADTSLCTYNKLLLKPGTTFNDYLWSNNSRSNSIEVNRPGTYWLRATDENNCTGTDSINVSQKTCNEGFYMPSGFTPNSDGKNDKIKPLIYGVILQYHFTVFDRFGNKIFESSNITEGWDGSFKGLPEPTNAFAWNCYYQLQGSKPVNEKGTITLIR